MRVESTNYVGREQYLPGGFSTWEEAIRPAFPVTDGWLVHTEFGTTADSGLVLCFKFDGVEGLNFHFEHYIHVIEGARKIGRVLMAGEFMPTGQPVSG